MNSFYSLIKFSTNPVASDHVTIGLLLRSDNNFFLKFSDRKIKGVLRLFDEDISFLDYFQKQLYARIDEANKDITRSKSQLFDIPSLLTADFVNHLNKSANNLIQFTEPSLISKSIDESEFKKLYALLVDKSEIDVFAFKEKSEKLQQNIYSNLISKVKDKIHTNYTIDNRLIPSIYFKIDLDCIGKNGSIIAAKSLDLEFSSPTIDRYLSHYSMIIPKLRSFSNNDADSFYLITDEPDSRSSENYKYWEAINKEEKLYKVIRSEESSKIVSEIENKDAKMFLPLE